MFETFHFIHPQWLLALLPLVPLLWRLNREAGAADPWRRIVDPRLLAALQTDGVHGGRRTALTLLAAGWLIAVVALANPAFERVAVETHRSAAARVVVLDLSRSMTAEDLTPSRLERARFKVADILARGKDGQTGLVAFAGDAFTVAPLSNDTDTITELLNALSPDLMPVQGSRPASAIALANDLLRQAGVARGDVILLTDDAGGDDTGTAVAELVENGHRLSVIGVGRAANTRLPDLRDSRGAPVDVQFDEDALRWLARDGGGDYARLSADGSDLNAVLRGPGTATRVDAEPAEETKDWRGIGPWLVLLLLPLGALAFRRGWVLGFAALVLVQGAVMPELAMAVGWTDLWQRQEQRAAAALAAGDHRGALELAEDPLRRGSASFRLGDYAASAAQFSGVDDAEAHYNRGNALAYAGQLDESLAAYDAALVKAADHEDARYNRDRVLAALDRQRQQDQAQQQQSKDSRGSTDQESQSDNPQEQNDQSGEQAQGDESEQQEGQGEQQAQSEDEAQEQDRQGEQQAQSGGESRQQGSASGTEEDSAEESAGQQASGEKPGDLSPRASGNAADNDSDDLNAAQLGDDEIERTAAEHREQTAAMHAADEREAQEQQAVDAASDQDPTPAEHESRQAARQWLRRIPDDPGGLLRRKFLYQYRVRQAANSSANVGNPW